MLQGTPVIVRRFGIGASAFALALAGFAVMASPASAVKPPPFAAHGAVSCTITKLQIKIKPGLTTTPASQASTVKGKATCSGTTGNGAVTVSAAKKITGELQNVGPTSCASLLGPQNIPIHLHVAWKAVGGKVFDSDVTFSNFNGSGTFTTPTGAGTSSITVGGSYGGEHANATASGLVLKGDCSAKHPVKMVSFSSGTLSVHVAGP